MEYLTPVQNLLNKTALHPNRVFLHQPYEGQWSSFTWLEVEQQARCIAAGLKAQGYSQGSRIGILSKNCAQWFIADLAIMMAGMISVPIYASAGQQTLGYVIKHSELQAIFVGKLDNTTAAEQAIPSQILRIGFPYPGLSAQASWHDWLTTYPALDELYQAKLDDTVSIIYTSGTTGQPKGVVITYKNWAASVQSSAHGMKQTSKDRVVSYLPLAHITERCLVEGVSYYTGHAVYFTESLQTFMRDVAYAKPTAFMSVPRLWAKFQAEILASIPEEKLQRLLSIPLLGRAIAYKIRRKLGLHHATRFGSGTAPIAVSVLQWYQSLGIPISEGWGMTETSGLSCINSPYVAKHLGTIGQSLSCVEIKLAPDNEVLIRGDAVFKQYYLDPKTSESAFIDGWFRTGDCGQVSASQDGSDARVYEITGRTKEPFKTAKGKYVAPVPIERALGTNFNIEQVCVVGSGLKQPVALLVLREGSNKNQVELVNSLEQTLKAVNRELESHQKLDYLLVCSAPWTIENELLTPTLKLKRAAIEASFNGLLEKQLMGTVLWQQDIE